MPLADVGEVSLNYLEEGSGSTLLLIPGLGLDHAYYRLGQERLQRSHTVVAVDPRGIGGSSVSVGPYTVERWAEDFARFIDYLDRGPVHVLGSSLGGAMALALARRHPESVKSLIVVGAFAELDRTAEINFRLRARLIERLGLGDEVADYMGLWTMTREFINSDHGYAQMRQNQQIIRRNPSSLYLAFVNAVLRWARLEPDQDGEPTFTDELARIQAPTLVVTADNDNLIPMRCSEIIAERIPGARLCVLPGAGHIPFIERPDIVCAAVEDFLAEQEHPASRSRSSVLPAQGPVV